MLAEQARKLLPEVVERPRPPTPALVAEQAAPPQPAPTALEPAPVAPRRRWRRMLVLAVLVFVAGAISGTLLGGKNAGPDGVTLAVPAEAPGHPAPQRQHADDTNSDDLTAGEAEARTSTRATLRPPSPRGERKTGWTSNMLGVEAQVDEAGVTLSWQRPASSGHVVVLRRRGPAHGGVVYEGKAASYSDSDVRPCIGYRYTIVNYDRRDIANQATA